MSWLKKAPIDWTQPGLFSASGLQNTLAEYYPNWEEGHNLAQKAGIPIGAFPNHSCMYTTWGAAMNVMANAGKLLNLVQEAARTHATFNGFLDPEDKVKTAVPATQQITLEIPVPKFQQGDVMKWGPGGLIVHIYGVEICGEWQHRNGKAEAWVTRDIYYNCAVQAGCGVGGGLIRPGTCTGFPEQGDPDHQMMGAEKIKWDKPIIEPDSNDNIGQRWKDWKNHNPEDDSVDQYENWARHPEREQRDRTD